MLASTILMRGSPAGADLTRDLDADSVGKRLSMNSKALAVSGHCICTTIVLLSYISVTGKR